MFLIDLSVKLDNLENDLFSIYKKLRPNAEKSKIVFKELKGGFVNLLYLLYPENDLENAIVFRTFDLKSSFDQVMKLNEKLKKTNCKEDDKNNDKPDNSLENNDNLYFDRSNEVIIMQSISGYNLCKPIYAKYLNGICFGYAPGVISYGPLMLTNDYLNEMSSKLAKLHSLKVEIITSGFKTHYDKMTDQFGPSIQPLIEMAVKETEKIVEFPYNKLPKLIKILEEDKYLKSKFEESGLGEITFCHNDLNRKNIIWNPQKRELNFIDFEMSMNNYVACELGVFFFSFAGHFLDEFVEEFLPNDNYRLKFIRRYLELRYEIKNEKPNTVVFEDEVQKLFIRSNICLLMFMVNIMFMAPFHNIKPEIFKVEETIKEKNNVPYFCGRYSLKIWQTYSKIKQNLLKPFDDYILNGKMT